MSTPKDQEKDPNSLTILRLSTNEFKEIEAIRQALSRRKGVSRVDVDYLKRVVIVEYDSRKVPFAQIKATVRGKDSRSKQSNE